jgi:hypothetical protein
MWCFIWSVSAKGTCESERVYVASAFTHTTDIVMLVLAITTMSSIIAGDVVRYFVTVVRRLR